MRTIAALTAVLALSACAAGRTGRTGPVRGGTILMNSEVGGVLTRNDARLNDRSVFHAWSFYGTQGQLVQVEVLSSDFDAFVILQGPAGNEIARDDDSGDGLNARLSVALPVTGQYRVIANTYRANQYGRYTVRLTGGGVMDVMPPSVGGTTGVVGTIYRGQTVTGRLSAADPRLADNTPYQAWEYSGTAGETITVDVTSRDFDAYAVIHDVNGLVLARDDDSGSGLNARLRYTLPYTGIYRILANTYRTGATGAYTLTLR